MAKIELTYTVGDHVGGRVWYSHDHPLKLEAPRTRAEEMGLAVGAPATAHLPIQWMHFTDMVVEVEDGIGKIGNKAYASKGLGVAFGAVWTDGTHGTYDLDPVKLSFVSQNPKEGQLETYGRVRLTRRPDPTSAMGFAANGDWEFCGPGFKGSGEVEMLWSSPEKAFKLNVRGDLK